MLSTREVLYLCQVDRSCRVPWHPVAQCNGGAGHLLRPARWRDLSCWARAAGASVRQATSCLRLEATRLQLIIRGLCAPLRLPHKAPLAPANSSWPPSSHLLTPTAAFSLPAPPGHEEGESPGCGVTHTCLESCPGCVAVGKSHPPLKRQHFPSARWGLVG